MGILDDAVRDLKRLKRKAKTRISKEVYGETKGERYNRRRLRMAQEAWARYNGPLSRSEFMSDYMRKGVSRSKEVLKQEVGKWDLRALKAAKNLKWEDVAEILFKLDIRRTPVDEPSFVSILQRNLPGGLREYGEFKFAGTIHRPDFYVNKSIVFECKIIYSNTELHTALGQGLIYRYKYPFVFVIVFDARQGYDAVDITGKEFDFLADLGVFLVKYPK